MQKNHPVRDTGLLVKTGILLGFILTIGFLIATLIFPHLQANPPHHGVNPSHHGVNSSPVPFFASIDTMKASRDTQTRQLSQYEINEIVRLSASLNTNYITVDTNWDYPAYMQEWVNAVRATNHHVWFRSHPNKWENDNGATGVMSPLEYEDAERTFIQQHPSLFRSGDIFDPCTEPEQGHYWLAEYQAHWLYNIPNNATREYNSFMRDTSDIADNSFKKIGIKGVITTIRSTNSFFATNPNAFEKATVDKFRFITVDSYPDAFTTDPAIASQARVKELQTIENLWHRPVVIGEMGYSNSIEVDDNTQRVVLKAELDALAKLPYVVGVNYWVGAGTHTSGGYTNILVKSGEQWSLRPAANELSAFYKARL